MFAADMEHYFAAHVRAPYSVFLKCVKTTQVQIRVTVVDAISEVHSFIPNGSKTVRM